MLQTLVFLTIQWAMVRGAMELAMTPAWVIVGVLCAAYIAAVVIWVRGLGRMIRRATDG